MTRAGEGTLSGLARTAATKALRIVVLAAVVAWVPACSAMSADYVMPLVWHVESDDGRVIDSSHPDQAINPASVTKLATSLRALETLGAEHRFTTTFAVAPVGGSGKGAVSLVVDGGADPDFHFENAILVAKALGEAGLERVHGDLFVGATFWIGWERGTVGREPDAAKRRLDMGQRLEAAWNPARWSAEDREAWNQIASRRHWESARPPSVVIDGRVRIDDPPPWHPVVVHRSEPLLVALRRFNVFSNNDIERLDSSIGPASGLKDFLVQAVGPEASVTSFETSSGLNRNRITPRLVVKLLRSLRSWLAVHGKSPSDVMPVLGCGTSTLSELFPKLVASGEAAGLVGKTGTLNLEDGGVSALAGFFAGGPGLVFFVAAPGSGAELPRARIVEEEWVHRVLLKQGAAGPLVCPAPVPTSDELAQVERVADETSH
ncbi:MAG TPA: D-alanyl-D-alanine carboxypeptidase [Candidatus Binatia bacterium]|jgi:D-alanyl-D-alanine carboxypeptidase/D-alanyl-D-alanine-endopeptidase (penicillin-binding protein 4)